jgi:plasmid stabilization system protein ParE
VIRYVVEFAARFHECIGDIEDYMAFHGRSEAAIARYTSEIYDMCSGLDTFPNRGVPHESVFPGLRITHYKGDTILAYVVDEESRIVTVVGAYYGGQDWQSMSASASGH